MTDHVHRATRERVANARRAAYLESWPEEAQREATIEAMAGRPDKARAMIADFDAIRARLPYPPEPPAEPAVATTTSGGS